LQRKEQFDEEFQALAATIIRAAGGALEGAREEVGSR
jgi:hypothetical protein